MRSTLPLFAFSAAGILLILGLASGFTDMVVHLGRHIPQTDVATDYYTGVVWAGILGLSIILWPVPANHKKPLLWAWAAKCGVTLFVMLFYESHYEGIDMYGLFYGSTNKWFHWEHLRNGTLNMRQLCWLHARVFPDSFHLMKVNCSYIGFISLYLFYRSATEFLGRDDFRYFAAMFISPSLHFFSSTLGKEPIILFGVAVYAYGVARWYRTGSLGYVSLIVLGAGETMLIRSWMGPILLAPVALLSFVKVRGGFLKFLLIIPVGAMLFFSTGEFLRQFRISNAAEMATRVDDITHSSGWEGGAGRQSIRFTNLGVMAGFIPLGILTALFRPLLGEVNNPFGIIVGLENMVYLWLLYRGVRRTRMKELSDPVLVWALLLLFVWSAFYGFASSQNMGAAVRYRLQIQPILLGLLLYFARSRATVSTPVIPAFAPQPQLP